MVDSAKIDRIKIFFFLGLTYKNKYNPSMHAIYPRSKRGTGDYLSWTKLQAWGKHAN